MSFRNFEHLEGVNPSDQFDRLGKKEDLGFSSEDLTEHLADNMSKDEINTKINEVQAKIVDLKEVIRTRGEEEEKLPLGFLETQGFELKEAEKELEVLETKARGLNAEQPKNRNFKEDLVNRFFEN
jgi:hypothetical protein